MSGKWVLRIGGTSHIVVFRVTVMWTRAGDRESRTDYPITGDNVQGKASASKCKQVQASASKCKQVQASASKCKQVQASVSEWSTSCGCHGIFFEVLVYIFSLQHSHTVAYQSR
jgi:hypothetical protein